MLSCAHTNVQGILGPLRRCEGVPSSRRDWSCELIFQKIIAELKLFTAEFYDSRAASDTIRVLNNQPVSGGTFLVSYVSDDPFLADPILVPRSLDSNTPRSGFNTSNSPNRAATPLNRSVSLTTPRSDRRLDFLSPSAATPPSFRRTQSGGVLSFQNQIDLTSSNLPSNGIPRTWTTDPARFEETWSTTTEQPSSVSAISRRATESAALQTLLDQMDLTARARRDQGSTPYSNMPHGSTSTPLSPTSPRGFSGWPQTDRQAIPPENVVYPDRILNGEYRFRSGDGHGLVEPC